MLNFNWPNFLLVAAGLTLSGLTAPAASDKTARPAVKLDYTRDIRPILAENCFACHGQDDQQRKARLRLDIRENALQPAKSGDIPIVPGNLSKSRLVERIASQDPDEVMPPPKSKKKLTAAQIDLLKRWIVEGADYKGHWAFVKPERPALPTVHGSKFRIQNPIDAFVAAKLEANKLTFAPEADKVTLIRRVYLDLIGLPPTIREVDGFLADKSSDAWSKVVGKLLASPHYGERWGRHWLDAARYADSDGYEKDMSREMWPYRDYVVGAFNRDLPYDRFVIEQIAGDLLPDASQDTRVATGFLRNSMVNMEGAIDPEQFRMESMFDRMDALGKGVLGLTIQCAQCHTHKYDPLQQEEYYRLFAFLNNDHEARAVVLAPDQQMKIAGLRRDIGGIEEDLKHRTADWEPRMAAWEDSVRHDQPEWIVLTNLFQEGDKSQRYEELPDGSLLACGYAPTKMTQWFRTTNDLDGVTAFRLELLNDPSLPYSGPGRAFNGTCALSEFYVETTDLKATTNKTKVKWTAATADVEQPERKLEPNFDDKTTNSRITGPISFAIDGNEKTAWGINAGPARRNQERKAVFTADKPAGYGSNTYWRIGLNQSHGGWNSDDHMNNNLGRFRVSIGRGDGEFKADPLPKKVRDIITSIPRERRTPVQNATVFSFWRTTVPEWKEANARIETLRDDWPEAATSLTLLAGRNRTTSILKRGDWLHPTSQVTPGVPAFLHPLPKDADSTRLTLARWLVDRNSPTTARVFVNRVWQAYFGTGIVGTSEDFGTQAEPPSHPELLDWLACELMSPEIGNPKAGADLKSESSGLHPWSIKHVHWLIVTSTTYKQSSHVTSEQFARDPYNRLLARGPRFRVEGEIVRDIALAASGLLNEKLGGRSVMPPAPDFLFQPPASYAPFPWKNEEGSEKYRRALYTFRRRSTPYPALQTFDVPNADASCVRRQRSNSPLQALVSLNEPIFVECAQALARKAFVEGGKSDAERVRYVFRRVLARPPDAVEQQELLALLEKEKRRIAEGWLNASEISSGKNEVPKDLPPGASPTQLAAYTVVSRVVLNLDETITKE